MHGARLMFPRSQQRPRLHGATALSRMLCLSHRFVHLFRAQTFRGAVAVIDVTDENVKPARRRRVCLGSWSSVKSHRHR